MTRFDTVIDAVAFVLRRDFRLADQNEDSTLLHFRRASWDAYVTRQKNGRWKVEIL